MSRILLIRLWIARLYFALLHFITSPELWSKLEKRPETGTEGAL